jgi:hypothetical protein
MLAEKNEKRAETALTEGNKVTASEYFLRAAGFRRSAIIYLPEAHGRMMKGYARLKEIFDKASMLVPPPFERVQIPCECKILHVFFDPARAAGPQGTGRLQLWRRRRDADARPARWRLGPVPSARHILSRRRRPGARLGGSRSGKIDATHRKMQAVRNRHVPHPHYVALQQGDSLLVGATGRPTTRFPDKEQLR